jgi:hypothetical protein
MGSLQVFSIIYSRVTAQDSDGLTAEAIEIEIILCNGNLQCVKYGSQSIPHMRPFIFLSFIFLWKGVILYELKITKIAIHT